MAQDLAKQYTVRTLPTGAHQKIGGKPNSGCGLRACQIFGPASFGQEPNATEIFGKEFPYPWTNYLDDHPNFLCRIKFFFEEPIGSSCWRYFYVHHFWCRNKAS
jgi:hypothetical protein